MFTKDDDLKATDVIGMVGEFFGAKAAHTPGPWKVTVKGENFFGIDSNDGNICILAAEDKKRIDKLANARLIATAPAILEALSLMVQYHCDHPQILDENANFGHEALNKAVRALAKARGEA